MSAEPSPSAREGHLHAALVVQDLGVAKRALADDPQPEPLVERLPARIRRRHVEGEDRPAERAADVHLVAQEHGADFCVASLTLDKVVKWTPPDDPKLQTERIVSYTYRIKAADWMSDSDARKVFPIVDRIIQGQGKLQMTATVEWRDGQWVPVMPGK